MIKYEIVLSSFLKNINTTYIWHKNHYNIPDCLENKGDIIL